MRLLYGSGAGTCQATQMIGRCHLGAAASPNRISAGRLSLAAGSALFVNAAGLVQRRRLTLQRSRFLCFSTPRRKSIGQRAVASEGDDFASLTHPNYTTQDKETYVGGWLAHRAAPDAEPGSGPGNNWVLEVAPAITRADFTVLGRKPRILVLYGSLRETSFSRKLAHEFARLFEVLGCDVRTYDPRGLPVRDPSIEDHAKVQEIRALSMWSDGHMWVSPEMHGTVTGAFKNQIDWLPLNTGSVRPTQGRTCCVAQVNGGSQSFNVVNTLRQLARWMRMPCCTNQSSVPKAWQEFDDDGRMKDSPLRDRVIDVAEEFVKYTAVLTPVADDLVDRYSERREKEEEGRLLTQAEKEERKSKGT